MFRLLSAQCYDTRAFRKGQKWDCTIVFERVHIRANLAQISHWTWYVYSAFNFIFLDTRKTGPTCSHDSDWRHRPWRPHVNAKIFQKATCRRKFSLFWIVIHPRWPTGFTTHLPVSGMWIKTTIDFEIYAAEDQPPQVLHEFRINWVWHCGLVVGSGDQSI